MSAELTGMVWIPGGDFWMGDDQGNSNERPRVRVHINTFRLEVHPVTNREYRRFLEENPQWRKENVHHDHAEDSYLKLWEGLEYPDGLDDYAVINVSWFAAAAYAAWAGRRLPTEAEWEFAAGGSLHTRYALGDEFNPRHYVFKLEGDPIGFHVCQHPANDFALYDMCGGVWEWTWDYYAVDAYTRLDPRAPVNHAYSERRTLRGGAYTFDTPHYLRCAVRGSSDPTAAHEDYGFRCAGESMPQI